MSFVDSKPIPRSLLSVALYIPIFLWVLLTLSTIFRVLRLTGAFWLSISFVVCSLLLALVKYTERRSTLLPRSTPLIIIPMFLVLAYMSAQIQDYSVDGMGYHLPAISSLLDGWNPLFEASGRYWQDVYPNGAWTIGAVFGALIGSPEAAKALNWLTLISAFLLVVSTIRRERKSFGLVGGVFSIAIVAQPTALQLMNFNMIDSALYYCCVGLAFSLSLHIRHNTQGALVAAACFCGLLTSFKTSGLYYAFIICAVLYTLHILTETACRWTPMVRALRQQITSGMTIVACTLFSLVVISFRPYFTNIQDHGSVLPERVVQTISTFRPENLIDAPAWTFWFHAVFGRTFHNHRAATELKSPFNVSSEELSLTSYIFSHGGFGPFMGAIVVLSVTTFLVAYATKSLQSRENQKNGAIFIHISVAFFLGALLFSEGWFARYITVLWAVPFLLLMSVLPPKLIDRNSEIRLSSVVLATFAMTISALALFNSFTTAKGSWIYSFKSQELERHAQAIAENQYERRLFVVSERNLDFNSELVWQRRFSELGLVAAIYPHGTECAKPAQLPSWPAKICYGEPELGSDEGAS